MPLFGPPNIEKLKEKRDVEGLVRVLHRKGRDQTTGKAAALALAELGDQRALEWLVIFAILIDDPDHQKILQAVVDTFGEGGLQRIIVQHRSLLIHHPYRREEVVRDLRTVMEHEPTLARRIARTIEDEAESHYESSIQLRAAVAEALGDADVLDPALRSYVIDVLLKALRQAYHWHSEIVVAAARSLGNLRAREALERLIEQATFSAAAPTLVEVWHATTEAVGKIAARDDETAVRWLTDRLGSEDGFVSKVAEAALERIGGPEAERALREYHTPQK